MKINDIHNKYEFFEYLRTDDGVPPADKQTIDVAVLDMNHSWPNLGHDSIVHAILESAEEMRHPLSTAGLKIRVLSYDVRRKLALPDSPNGRFALYIGSGGPGHLDPRQNNGVGESSQGINETPEWEAPLFRLYDAILKHPAAALIGICHSFGLMCRWSGVAHPELRSQKSSGMPLNALSPAASQHPWFSQFAGKLKDRQHFRVVDNRLFDLVLDSDDATPIAFEQAGSEIVTIAEFARSDEMPRVLGVNHHPEIIDREHVQAVLNEKRAHAEVTEEWYLERAHMLENEMQGAMETESRLTSHYTFVGPLRFHLERQVRERSGQ